MSTDAGCVGMVVQTVPITSSPASEAVLMRHGTYVQRIACATVAEGRASDCPGLAYCHGLTRRGLEDDDGGVPFLTPSA